MGIFGINTSNTTNTASDNTNQRLIFKAIGGEPSVSLFGNIQIGSTLPNISTAAWEASSSLLNAEMIDISLGGLLPLWGLINDPMKKQAVKDYITQYLINNRVKLTPDPVNVLYNATHKNHVYTINKDDYPYIQNGFTDLSVNFHAFVSQAPGTQPIHAFYQPTDKNHVYTINKNDYPYLQNGFQYLGVAFYAYPSQVQGSTPIHSFFQVRQKNHVYTINYNEYPYLGNPFYLPVI